MPFAALIPAAITAGGSILSGILGRSAANNAAKAQVAAALKAQGVADTNLGTGTTAANANTAAANANWQKTLDANMGLLDKGFGSLTALDPYKTAGSTAATGLNTELQNPFQFDFTKDPGYAWRLAQGQKAIEASAAARGGLMSGGNLKALTQYGQGFASNEYQNAFARHQQQLQNLFQGAGLGLNAATTGINAGNTLTGMGINAGNLFASGTSGNLNENSGLLAQMLGQNSALASQNYTGAGNAQAAGIVGGTNAITGAISGVSNAAQQAFLYNLLLKGSGGGGGGTGSYQGPPLPPGYVFNDLGMPGAGITP